MKLARIIIFILLISFGIFMIVFGEKDDSPGAQLLGVIGVIFGLVGIIKNLKKN